MSLIRTGSLLHYPDVARSVGLDPNAMLTLAGMRLESLQSPQPPVPAGRFRRLLELSAEKAGIDDFGLRLAALGNLTNLGPVAFVVREQPTVGAAIETLARYIHVQNETVRVRIEKQGDLALLIPTVLVDRPTPLRQSIDLTLGVAYQILAGLLGSRWRPLEVHFTYPRPRSSESRQQFFCCDTVFSSEFDGIVMSARDLERPLQAANAVMARHAQAFVESLGVQAPDIADKVQELVSALLPTGRCSLGVIAGYFGCEPRTLQRMLRKRNLSFSEILDNQRAEFAIRLIEGSDRPISSVADLLGFTAQSALARWFKDHFGCSISEWRAQKANARQSGEPSRKH